MRVFLDTNVLVSAVATRGLCADLVRAVLAEHELILGETVVEELRRVLRDKIGVPPDTIAELESFLRSQGTVAPTPSVPPDDGPGQEEPTLPDPGDRAVLAEAVASSADVLVTGDADLLNVAPQAPLPIVPPRGLWDRLRALDQP